MLLPKRDEQFFQSWEGEGDWLGAPQKEPSQSPRTPQDTLHALLRAAALQGIRGSAEVLLTQLLPERD